MKLKPFPDLTYAFAADTDSTHAYGNPLVDSDEVDRRVAVYEKNENVTEIRVAEYRLVRVSTVYVREPATT